MEVEKHEKQFRGVWMSPEVIEMVENGEISCKEAILLMVIDSLIKHKGKACFASNDYLGSRIHSKKRQVMDMIQHLKKLEILEQTRFDGRRRFLATIWSASRIADTRKKVRQTRGKRYVRHAEKGTSLLSSKEVSSKEVKESISASKNPDADGVNVSKGKKGWNSHPRWIEYATLLKGAIGSVRKVNKTSDTWRWAEALSKLQSVDSYSPRRIRTVLKWYCHQLQKGDLIKDNSSFIPIAYSGANFREKFLRIEDAIKRLSKNDVERGPRIRVVREEDE